jgi:hypothetical protein
VANGLERFQYGSLGLQVRCRELAERDPNCSRGLRLYDNDSPLAQTRTQGTATAFAIDRWYTLDLQVAGDRLVGRLYDDYDNRKLLEQVEFTLHGVDDHHHAGMIARDKGERTDWFQAGVRVSAKRRSVANGVSGKENVTVSFRRVLFVFPLAIRAPTG